MYMWLLLVVSFVDKRGGEVWGGGGVGVEGAGGGGWGGGEGREEV